MRARDARGGPRAAASRRTLTVAAATAAVPALLIGQSAVAMAALALLARRRLGGYTGDVLGAAQQAGEIVMLLAASV